MGILRPGDILAVPMSTQTRQAPSWKLDLRAPIFCVHSVILCGSGMWGLCDIAELSLLAGELGPGLVWELFKREVTARASAGVCEVSSKVGGMWCEPA